MSEGAVRYTAAGGVVARDDRVLVLRRSNPIRINLTFEQAESAGRVAPKGRVSRPSGLGETRPLGFDTPSATQPAVTSLGLTRMCPNSRSVSPNEGEVRLPKGHVDPGETARETALREVREESGYADLTIEADLGTQLVEFEHKGRHVVRSERYFLMTLADDASPPGDGEEQFEPAWLNWDEALAALTFEAEREWVRRARAMSQ